MVGARRAWTNAGGLLAVATLASACATLAPPERELLVTATAYNAERGQTDRTPDIGAWGDRLHPGMRAIAVSADLHALGLVRGSRVRIEGLRGEYQVLDRMPRRWQRRIDILMADRRTARSWGKRTVRIQWEPPPPESPRFGFLCGLFGTCG